MMKEIGGFFELSFGERGKPYHDAIKLNSGRNALKYILKASRPDKVYLPYYICNSVLEPLNATGIKYEFYHIDESLEPIFNKALGEKERLLYVNYFGVKDRTVKALSRKYANLIIDNTQAFFSKPLKGVDTFYSPRKFFGVADGGYLYTAKKLREKIDIDTSYKRYGYLLQRLDVSASEGYESFIREENRLKNQPIRIMSKLTSRILENIDYQRVKAIRKNNFLFLHSLLSKINEFDIDVDNLNVPMVYPFLFSKKGLRDFLIRNKIYVATYWNEVCARTDRSSLEYRLTKHLLSLPIDQRYGIYDMKRIYAVIKDFI